MALPLLALQKGLVNLGIGVYPAESIIHCEADGQLTLTWKDGTPENGFNPTTTDYSMIAGEDRAIYDVDKITIISGTFTMSKQ